MFVLVDQLETDPQTKSLAVSGMVAVNVREVRYAEQMNVAGLSCTRLEFLDGQGMLIVGTPEDFQKAVKKQTS